MKNDIFNIFAFEIKTMIKSKWLISFSVFYFLTGLALFMLSGGGSKLVLNLFTFSSLLIPVIALFYNANFLYNEKKFIEMLLSQPVKRSSIYWGIYLSLTVSLSAILTISAILAFIFSASGFEIFDKVIILFLLNIFTVFIFTGISFLTVFTLPDRAKGFIALIFIWVFAFIAYDAIILVTSYLLSDYPVENYIFAAVISNPVDISRIIMMMQFDISALMGYTAAIYKMQVGESGSLFILFGILFLWVILPGMLAKKLFTKRDFL